MSFYFRTVCNLYLLGQNKFYFIIDLCLNLPYQKKRKKEMESNKEKQNSNWIEKLKTRWQVNSAWQVFVILIVFALTGFTVMYGKRWFFEIIGFDETTPWQTKTILWIVLILPVYQVVLLFYGAIFGQFNFFWNFVKRTFGRIFFFLNKDNKK
jgi:hypothetical protein